MSTDQAHAPGETSASTLVDASAAAVWAVVADPRRMPEVAPSLKDTQWAQGTTAPAVGAVFASHIVLPRILTMRRGLIRPASQPRADTWFYFRITGWEPERALEFENVAPRGVTATGYRLVPEVDGPGTGTQLTTYTRPPSDVVTRVVRAAMGSWLRRRQEREMTERLVRIRALAEAAS